MSSLNYGGQAVIEGVMMRGAQQWAVSVRAPDGRIVQHQEPLPAGYRNRWLQLPLLRGLVSLWDALGLGTRALLWSSNIAEGQEDQAQMSGAAAWGTVAASLALGIGVFFLLPMALTSLTDRWLSSSLASNLLEGALRLVIFVVYLLAMGLMPEIRRVFAYHGAEHKTINAYEAGAELTPEAVAAFSRQHVRCGTGFMLIVLIIFVLVSSLLGRPSLLVRLASRVVLIPLVSGIAYEVIKFSARHYETSRTVRWCA